jgi:hypothetical protein
MMPTRIAVFFSAAILGNILKIKATANCKQKLMLNQKLLLQLKCGKNFNTRKNESFDIPAF